MRFPQKYLYMAISLALLPTLTYGQSSPFNVRVLQVGDAKVSGDKALEGKILTGVIVEIGSTKPDATANFDASAVSVTGVAAKPVQAAVLFIAKGSETKNIAMTAGPGGAQMLGLEIVIGEKKFEAFGANPMAYSLAGRNGGTFIFKQPGVAQFGFVFLAPRKDVSNINVLGKSLPLR